MSKAVLVIDMPESCGRCALKDVGEYSDTYCHVANKPIPISTTCRPDWCPLVPMPERASHPDWCDGGRYDKGYNDCIDAIIGGKANE